MPTSPALTTVPSTSSSDANKTPSQQFLNGSTAAGARALGTQIVAFYFRAPVKSFLRLRVDYMTVARAIRPPPVSEGWSFASTTPGLLYNAVKLHGWGFIPRQVLPPLFANATVGAILYTSYLQTLGVLHEESKKQRKRVYPPPGVAATFAAGATAGAVQSVIAAPLDALVVRFNVQDMLQGGYKSVYHYSRDKLIQIGVKGVWSGFALSFAKESLGYGLFFSSFEFVKQQSYYRFISWLYSGPSESHPITPHFLIEPSFLLLAGACASITQQSIQYPLTKIQSIHYTQLESLDYVRKTSGHDQTHPNYKSCYKKTWKQCLVHAKKAGGMRRWLWQGLFMNTVRQIPSTSAGLFVFEVFRRRYGEKSEEPTTVIVGERRLLLA
ncbi:mitochondrial carrier domain-containing protein [Pyronema domesticum]|uniref:Similar to Mitochondrial substrate carrier family protein S acc. no. Q54FE6 n=1 Tax=Pyronema omphalodes (strain CBS 100304) TaxID=1076935 RepID=U4L2K1_PYROM|nr:mitochondrial carrier domain-containing protein [Pyronema domesticum]CCX06493.1 Similar to Mitochondrial substrate carrier family protein S; acc. no. Q54FE6 [Pyronema omphalodes CBS 100304]